MSYLLDLSVPVSFTIICLITVSISLIGLKLVRRKYTKEVLKENHEVAAVIFNAFGVLYAVLVAFVVFVTWNGYTDANKNLQMEANESADLFHTSKAFPDSVGKPMREALLSYMKSVYGDEMKTMAWGEESPVAIAAIRKLLSVYINIDMKSFSNQALYAESLKRLNDLAGYRRLRVFAGNNTMPPVIWVVILIGSLMTILYTYFFGMNRLLPQMAMTSALTITLTLTLFLIYILDHPFSGSSAISSEPLKRTIEIMALGY
jgi:hypothetical protein